MATIQSINSVWAKSPERLQSASVVTPPSPSFTWSLRALCVAALGVTGYLAFTALRSEDVAGCGGGALWDCGFALNSRWSKFLGLPVSVPAFALYAVLLSMLTVCRPTAPLSRLRLAWGMVTVGAILSALAAVWFIGLQVFAIGHLCVYCLAAHLCGLALGIAILWKRPLGGRTTAMLACVAAAGVGLLIAGQALAAPPTTFKVEHYATNDAPVVTTTSNMADPSTQAKAHATEVFEAPGESVPPARGNDE